MDITAHLKVVNPKIKISPCHPQVIPCVHGILLSDEYNLSYITNVLAFPSFIMSVNGFRLSFEVHKSASIHYKSDPHFSGVFIK